MDSFSRRIFEKIIARALKQRNYISTSKQALDIFVDSIIYYLSTIAKRTSEIATRSGRIDVNGFDVFCALGSIPETPITLSQFLNTSANALPFFDYYIQPYPIVLKSSFYTSQATDLQTHFFRSNTIFFFPDKAEAVNHSIPPAFPRIPSKHTYSHEFQDDHDIPWNESLRNDNEQKEMEDTCMQLKESLEVIRTNYDDALVSFTAPIGDFSKPSEPLLKASKNHYLDGSRDLLMFQDPEFIRGEKDNSNSKNTDPDISS